MTVPANARFSEYATSGAFTLGLSRNQVSTLAMIVDGQGPGYFGPATAALERKGLVEAVAHPQAWNLENFEYRATFAGLLTASLIREAGLTNQPPDVQSREIQRLHAELADARRAGAEMAEVARSALARKAKIELDAKNAAASTAGAKMEIALIPRDPLPDRSDPDLWAAVNQGFWAMTERERLAAKIRALREKTVANGCTEAEAIAAAEKVAEMLARYNMSVDEAELRASPFSRHAEEHADLVGDRLWKPANAIAELTGCRTWTAEVMFGGKSEITFFGFDHEVEIASYLLAICAGAMLRGQAAATQQVAFYRVELRRRRILSFLDGMADRLFERIMALRPPQPVGKGLVVLRSELIEAALAERGIEIEVTRERSRPQWADGYQAGRRAGDQVALSPGISARRAQGAIGGGVR